jgi:hypothetical protein
MICSLPALNIRACISERQKITSSWESDFEKNHTAFAENVACGIAKQFIEKLINTIKDPYQKPIDSKNRLVSDISLEITKSRIAKKILRFIEGNNELPPFNDWLTKFSADEKQLDLYSIEENKKIDRKYFIELMAIVGQLAEKKLSERFSEFTANSEHQNLQFKVEWYQKSDQQLSNPSDFRDNCLRIELWFNEKAILKLIEEKSPAIIEEHRIKLKERRYVRMRNNIIVAVVVVIIGLVILKSGIIEIRPPIHKL